MRSISFKLLPVLIVSLGSGLAAAADGGRVALVIGNTDYQSLTPVRTASQDARAMASALADLDFTVEIGIDLDAQALSRTVQGFSGRAADAETALVGFFGRGQQLDGENYLLPTDTRPAEDPDWDSRSLPLSIVMEAVASAQTIGVVLVDAARSNDAAFGVDAGSGLAPVLSVPPTVVVSLSALPGDCVDDGYRFTGAYAAALIQHLPTQDIQLSDILLRARQSVINDTVGEQEPALFGNATTIDYILNPAPEPEPVAAVEETPEAEPEPIAAVEDAPDAEPEPEPIAAVEDAPDAEPEPEPIAAVEDAPDAEPEPEPIAAVEDAPDAEPEPEPIVAVEDAPEAEPEPEPIAAVEDAPEAEPEPEPVAAVEDAPDAEPEPVAEAAAPVADSVSDDEQVATVEPEPEAVDAPEEAEIVAVPEPEATPAALSPDLRQSPTQHPLMNRQQREAVQRALQQLGLYDYRVDAIFGQITRSGMRAFQERIGAEATGFLSEAQIEELYRQAAAGQ